MIEMVEDMTGNNDSPRDVKRPDSDPVDCVAMKSGRRWYGSPRVVRQQIPAVVMGGSGNKVEIHGHQRNRRP